MLLFELFLKATVLLGLCGLLAALTRTPALRHAMWAAGLLGILAILPIAGVPGWRVMRVGIDKAPPAAPAPSIPEASQRRVSRVAADDTHLAPSTDAASKYPINLDTASTNRAPAPALSNHASSSAAANDTLPRQPLPIDWSAWAIRIWLAGMFLMLMPLAMASRALRRMLKTARPLQSEVGAAAFKAIVTHRNLNVRLLESHRCDVPMVVGVFRPCIVVPVKSAGWPEECWRMVLLHELAHAKRRDVAVKWMGQLARAAYWFHPLAWVALARLGIEAEKACDDLVIQAGTSTSLYAAALVDIAEAWQRRSIMSQTALHMARHSTLETRVRRVLDEKCRRSTGKRHAAIFAAAIVLLAGGLGILRAADGDGAAAGTAHKPAFFVLGDLPQGQSGSYNIGGPDFRLLDALKLVDVDEKFGQGKTVTLVRHEEPNRETRAAFPYAELAKSPARDVVLRDNDTLIIARDSLPVIAADTSSAGGRFSVLGGVSMPGEYDMDGRTLTLMQALAVARFDHDGASTHRVDLIRKRDEKAMVIPVHIAAILAGTEPDRYIQNGDILNISTEVDQVREAPLSGPASAPASQPAGAANHAPAAAAETGAQTYYVMGAVGRPGEFSLHGEMGVLQALAAAGAGEDLNMLKITLIRRDNSGKESRKEIALDNLLLNPGDDVVLQGRDVLVVQHNMARARELLDEMSTEFQDREKNLERLAQANGGRIPEDQQADVAAHRKSLQDFEDQVAKWTRE